MSNTSATGGYLLPTTPGLPGGLTFDQFVQTIVVGISGYPGDLVRPKWQPAPPKQPDIYTEWIAYGVQEDTSDPYAYVNLNGDGSSTLSRQTQFDIQFTFYGPSAMNNIAAFRDGFQIQQNLEAMSFASMGFTKCSRITRFPELINERWFNRADMTLTLARQIVRTYQVVSFASASGIINTILGNTTYSLNWSTPTPP